MAHQVVVQLGVLGETVRRIQRQRRVASKGAPPAIILDESPPEGDGEGEEESPPSGSASWSTGGAR